MLLPVYGFIEVYKYDGKELKKVHEHKNTIGSGLHSQLRDAMVTRAVNRGIDAIAWGSHHNPGGTFVDSDYSGTTSTGTKGSLIQSSIGSNQAKFSGTFSFTTTDRINYFQMGQGYTAAGAGISNLFSYVYAYDNSLQTGSTYIEYVNGETLIVNWTIQVGA